MKTVDLFNNGDVVARLTNMRVFQWKDQKALLCYLMEVICEFYM